MFGLLGACLFSLSLLFFSLAAMLRLLPNFLHLVRLGLRGLLILSFRLYYLLFRRMAAPVKQRLNINILSDHWRVIFSVLFSLVLGLFFLLLTGWPVTGWGIGLTLLHGLCVGLAWDEIENPAGLQLGARHE